MPDISKAMAKVIRVNSKVRETIGSAFFISKHHLITATHVVNGLQKDDELCIIPYIGHDPINVVCIKHPNRDIALLTLSSQALENNFLPLCQEETLDHTGEVTVHGFTEGSDKNDARKRTLLKPTEDGSLRFDGDIPSGFSGGPVVDSEGHCIGVCYVRLAAADCCYAVPVQVVQTWLAEQGIKPNQPVLAEWEKDYLTSLCRELKHMPSDNLFQELAGTQPAHLKLRTLYAQLHVDNPKKGSAQGVPGDNNDKIESRKETIPALTLLATSSRVVLSGAPGSGKSTLSRYLTLRLAQNLLGHVAPSTTAGEETLPAVLDNYFPLRIDIAEFYQHQFADKLAQNSTCRSLLPIPMNQALADFLQDRYGLSTEYVLEHLPAQSVLWVFDGLDEINVSQEVRLCLLETIADWARILGDSHRVYLTTRPYAFKESERTCLQGYLQSTIQPLAHNAVFHFIDRFCQSYELNEEKAKRYSATLVGLLKTPERAYLLELCQNPLLLTLSVMMYCKGGEQSLPKDRADLYERCIDTLLRRWENKQQHGDNEGQVTITTASDARPILKKPKNTVLTALYRLGFYAHNQLMAGAQAKRNDGDFDKKLIQQYFCREFLPDINEEQILGFLNKKTGIVIDLDGGQYRFLHRTFREYLCACYLLTLAPSDYVSAIQQQPDWWGEVLSLAARLSDRDESTNQDQITSVLMACNALTQKEARTHQAEEALRPLLFATANAEVERLYIPQETRFLQGVWRQRLIDSLLATLQTEGVSPEDKAEAARYLGELGDPRPGVGRCKRHALPDIQWVEVPPGTLTLERGHNPYCIKHPFKLAKYPITNAQFHAFVEDKEDGYTQSKWWQGFEQEKLLTPPPAPRWPNPNHPRVDVTWYEAMAFCRWLNGKLHETGILEQGWTLRLPLEWEWQWAACSAQPDWQYPWGSTYEAGHANIDETFNGLGAHYLQQTSAVGLYEQGKTHLDSGQVEAYDLAGNVWEWCYNTYDNPNKGIEILSDDFRSIRGGAWGYLAENARAAYRDGAIPVNRDSVLGFRVVLFPPSSGH